MVSKSDKDAIRYIARKKSLQAIRAEIESTMDEITELVVPHRCYMNSDMSYGYLPNQDIYDQTGTQSLKFLTSLVDSGTASAGINWFSVDSKVFLPQKPELLTLYLKYITDVISDVFSDPAAGFYSGNPVVISDMGAYGTACMSIDYSPGEGFRFTPIHISDIYISEGAFGHIDTVIRRLKVTAHQCAQRFEESKLPDQVIEALDSDPDKIFEVWHYAMPNPDYTNLKKAGYKNQKYKSCYVMEQSDKDANKLGTVLEESGMSFLPYNVPRWFKRPNMPWGFGPAMLALPNLRSIQNMEMEFQSLLQLTVRPILLAADDGVILPSTLEPGTIVQGGIDSLNNARRIEPLQMGLMPQFLEGYLRTKKDEIKKLFYNASIMFHDGPEMTREEVMTRKEEQMLALGPDLKLYMEEHLIPTILKVYELLVENKLIEPPPKEIAEIINRGLRIEFNSPLLRYQRIGEIQAAERILQAAVQLAQFDPSVMNVVNPRGLLEVYRDVLQAPSAVFNTEEQQKAIEEAQMQERQQQMKMELADKVDKNAYMMKQAGGDPNTSALAATSGLNQAQQQMMMQSQQQGGM
jgi:hypothetical protein